MDTCLKYSTLDTLTCYLHGMGPRGRQVARACLEAAAQLHLMAVAEVMTGLLLGDHNLSVERLHYGSRFPASSDSVGSAEVQWSARIYLVLRAFQDTPRFCPLAFTNTV